MALAMPMTKTTVSDGEQHLALAAPFWTLAATFPYVALAATCLYLILATPIEQVRNLKICCGCAFCKFNSTLAASLTIYLAVATPWTPFQLSP